MIVIIIRDICQIKDDENPLEAVAWGSEAGRRQTELVCSIGAVVFPHLQKPSCVFSVGEEEEGRKGLGPGRFCCQSPRGPAAGAAFAAASCDGRAPCCSFVHPEVSVHPPGWGVLCTLRPQCIPPGGFCAPRGFSASPRGVSVHPKTSVHPPGGFLCTPRLQCIPPGGFCAPQDLSASPWGVSLHPEAGSFAGCPSSDCSLYLWCDICNIVYFSYVSSEEVIYKSIADAPAAGPPALPGVHPVPALPTARVPACPQPRSTPGLCLSTSASPGNRGREHFHRVCSRFHSLLFFFYFILLFFALF
ncbi:uncharacterized protein J5F26_009012 [Ciconia maguari]